MKSILSENTDLENEPIEIVISDEELSEHSAHQKKNIFVRAFAPIKGGSIRGSVLTL